MGVKILFKNKKIYKGEQNADIEVTSPKTLKSINCPTRLNSGAIDEFLVIFLIAAKAKGVSYFKDLAELDQKESPRLQWGANLNINKKIIIKDYLKDHRVFMTSIIAGLTFGGTWEIHDKDSIRTSFPNFLNIINDLKR